MENNIENLSGVNNGELYSTLNKFNWGAFFLTWIWGVGNRTYITFLALPAFVFSLFVPIAHLAFAIWFGVKGNEWAWKNNKWVDAEGFNKSQKIWAILGTVIGLFLTCLKIGIIVFMIVLLFTSGVADKAYDKAMKTDACIQYEALKNSPNMTFETLVKYKDLKDECGAEFLFAIIEKLAE